MQYQIADRMNLLPFSGIRKMMEKANQMQASGENILHLELGRPDFDTPEKIKQAAYKSIRDGNVFYTSNYGTNAVRLAVSEKLRRDNGIAYSAEEILITNGVTEGTYAVFGALLQEGDEVLVPNPVWVNYIHVPFFFGAKTVPYTLKEERGFQPDPGELEILITEKTKMIVLVSPGNPTGSVLERSTLEQIAVIAKNHNLLVVSDEIYEKLVYGEAEHVSIASLEGMKERTITLGGFSKTYSMTGWRLGYIAAPVEIISAAVRVQSDPLENLRQR